MVTRKLAPNGVLGDLLEKGRLGGGRDIPFTSIGVLTPNTDDRALGPPITSRSRSRSTASFARSWQLSTLDSAASDGPRKSHLSGVLRAVGGAGTFQQFVGQSQVSQEQGNGGQAGGQHPGVSDQRMVLPGFG